MELVKEPKPCRFITEKRYKARRIPPEVWEQYRERIHTLYRKGNPIKSILERIHSQNWLGFKPSEKQLRDQIGKTWKWETPLARKKRSTRIVNMQPERHDPLLDTPSIHFDHGQDVQLQQLLTDIPNVEHEHDISKGSTWPSAFQAWDSLDPSEASGNPPSLNSRTSTEIIARYSTSPGFSNVDLEWPVDTISWPWHQIPSPIGMSSPSVYQFFNFPDADAQATGGDDRIDNVTSLVRTPWSVGLDDTTLMNPPLPGVIALNATMDETFMASLLSCAESSGFFICNPHIPSLFTKQNTENKGVLQFAHYMIENNLQHGRTLTEFFNHVARTIDLKTITAFILDPGNVADGFIGKIWPFFHTARRLDVLKYLRINYINFPRDLVLDLLHLAVLEEDADLVQDILQSEFACGIGTGEASIPFRTACAFRNTTIVQMFLNAGITLSDFNTRTWNPLHSAISGPASKGYQAISDFSEEADPQLLRILIQAGADPSLATLSPTLCAARNGNLNTLRYLVDDCGARIGRCELSLAKAWKDLDFSISKSLELAKLLIKSGAPQSRLLESAAYAQLPDLVQELSKDIELSPQDLRELMRTMNPKMRSLVTSAFRRLPEFQNFRTLGSDVGCIELLLDFGISPECQKELVSSVDAAATAGNITLVNRLLEIAVKHQDEWNLSAFSIEQAVQAGQFSVAKQILEFGAEVSWNEIKAAILEGDYAFALYLAERSFDCDVLDIIGIFLHHVQPGYDNLLLKHHSEGNEGDDSEIIDTLLAWSLLLENHQLFRVLMEKYVPVGHTFDLCGCFSFRGDGCILAISSDMLKMAFEFGVSLNDSLLKLAVRIPDEGMVQIILDEHRSRYGACQKVFGISALIEAIERNELVIIRKLLAHGVDPFYMYDSTSGFSSAMSTPHAGSKGILDELLRNIQDPNALVEFFGRKANTVLIAAIDQKAIEVVESVIQAGANIDLLPTPQTLMTPLQAACEAGNLPIVKLLLSKKAEVNADPFPINGATALQFAACNGHMPMVLLLLEHGAKIDAPGAKINGRTAVMGAAENGRLAIFELLLNLGADIRGENYMRIKKLAEKNGHYKLARLLESRRMDTGMTVFPRLEYSMDCDA